MNFLIAFFMIFVETGAIKAYQPPVCSEPFITLPVYLRASLWGLLGFQGAFQITAKGAKKNSRKIFLLQLIFWVVSLAALVWGAQRFFYERSPVLLTNVGWIGCHFILFSSLFYFQED